MYKRILLPTVLILIAALALAACQPTATPAPPGVQTVEVTRIVEVVKEVPVAEKKLKACFIYVGPIGDIGWTHAHDQGRKIV
ncbi:MAG: BMP family ABC transporter substrate-binding protein, partial [Anaerolineae bacterium]|nr:BMP family ABC transporter substrate-binding protein [Anaerolineae bacterium]